ncbi:MAG TPA: FAD synthetase family protein [Candidatus Limnocylindrales bacterium]|jgi:riboflavin kinase/FMN adenylyltransferase|nr:FAD synthetase family protein [Candidatus Limnocylindrales bacterium]
MTDDPALAPGPPFVLVPGVDALRPEHGPIFAVVGVFDGLHLGHRWLLDALKMHAERIGARPAVITFDSHPDEVLVGAAPPLLLDPGDRLRLLQDAGVSVVVVQHFDQALRQTPYDRFVGRITARTRLAGLLMTPDAAFGHERRGTPDALAELGRRSEPAFEVVVVPPFALDGRPVSSSEIRRLVQAGALGEAGRLLGRPYSVAGSRQESDGVSAAVPVSFPLPVALPPVGAYAVTVVDAVLPGPAGPAVATVRDDPASIEVAGELVPPASRLRIVFD